MDNRTIFAFVFAPFIVPLVVVGHAVVSGTIFIPDPPDSSLRYTVLPYALLFVMSMLVAYGMEILMGLGVWKAIRKSKIQSPLAIAGVGATMEWQRSRSCCFSYRRTVWPWPTPQ